MENKIYLDDGQKENWQDPNKWESNQGRRNRIEKYRKLTNLSEEVEITEEHINKNQQLFNRVCLDFGVYPDRLKSELLNKKYTGYEED